MAAAPQAVNLVRAFALDELGGQASEARARHRRYFAKHVAGASARFDAGDAPGEVAGPLLPDHANRAAIRERVPALA
jgi:hypothetical protein